MGVARHGAVTARGVRDGDPAALTGLASVRGAAVLAYCERLCDARSAVVATGDAFARFRSAVYTAPSLEAVDPEALLLSRTRQAAAEHALPPAPEAGGALRRRVSGRRSATCSHIATLLAARVNGELSEADRDRLERHLARCSGCRVIEARFDEAERAYRDAQQRPPDPAVAMTIVDALAAAAPVADAAQAHRVNGDGSQAQAAGAGAGAAAGAPPAIAFVAPDEPQPDYGDGPAAVEGAPAAPRSEPQPPPEPPAQPEPQPIAVALPVAPEQAPSLDEPGGSHEGEPATVAFAAGAALAARRARGALLRPGARRSRSTRPDPALREHRHGFAARVAGPAVIVALALLAALAVAGVFESGNHAGRRAAAAAPAPAAVTPQPQPAPAAGKHRRHHHRRHHPRTHQRRRGAPTPSPTPAVATAAPRKVASAPAPVATPAPSHSTAPTTSQQPSTAHVLGGPSQQAPPQTGAPGGAPSGYQPASP